MIKKGGKEDESSLFTIFVLPEYQGKGIGRKIIETLEKGRTINYDKIKKRRFRGKRFIVEY